MKELKFESVNDREVVYDVNTDMTQDSEIRSRYQVHCVPSHKKMIFAPWGSIELSSFVVG